MEPVNRHSRTPGRAICYAMDPIHEILGLNVVQDLETSRLNPGCFKTRSSPQELSSSSTHSHCEAPLMESITALLIESCLVIVVTTLSLVAIGYALVHGPKNSARGPPLPPGPPRQFLIGNLRQFPADHFYDKFSEWHTQYGAIVYVQLPGIPIVILNSYEVAQELLAKRPSTTAGRNMPHMAQEVMGAGWRLPFLQSGLHHSNQRKMLRRGIGPQRIGSYNQKIERTAEQLMLNLQEFEGNPHPLLLRSIGQSVTEIAYGDKVRASMGKELSSWNSEAFKLINAAFNTFWFANVFHSCYGQLVGVSTDNPTVRFVPSWLPGAGFRRIGIRSTWLSHQIRYTPFERAKELYKSGEIGHSLANDFLDEFGPGDDVRDVLGSLFSAGTDTTSSAVLAFLYALFLFPEVSQKVYREVAAVTEGTRMPRIEDRSHFLFTEAVWKEAWRWNTFFPLGVPHVTSEDEIIDGYLIKAGTVVNINTGSMMMDPQVWGDPEAFRPERFLAADAGSPPIPQNVIFGYGMRVCPGRYFADRSGFHIAATMAALYDIAPLEGRVRPDPKSVQYTDTILRLPVDFECRFIPRSDLSKQVLKAASI